MNTPISQAERLGSNKRKVVTKHVKLFIFKLATSFLSVACCRLAVADTSGQTKFPTGKFIGAEAQPTPHREGPALADRAG